MPDRLREVGMSDIHATCALSYLSRGRYDLTCGRSESGLESDAPEMSARSSWTDYSRKVGQRPGFQ
jgi:hypothetical protein